MKSGFTLILGSFFTLSSYAGWGDSALNKFVNLYQNDQSIYNQVNGIHPRDAWKLTFPITKKNQDSIKNSQTPDEYTVKFDGRVEHINKLLQLPWYADVKLVSERTDVNKPFMTFFKLTSDRSCSDMNINIENSDLQSSIFVNEQKAYLKDDQNRFIYIGDVASLLKEQYLILDIENKDTRTIEDKVSQITLHISNEKIVHDLITNQNNEVTLNYGYPRKNIMETPKHNNSGVLVKINVSCQKN